LMYSDRSQIQPKDVPMYSEHAANDHDGWMV
jgi:hypothetical protein